MNEFKTDFKCPQCGSKLSYENDHNMKVNRKRVFCPLCHRHYNLEVNLS